MLVCLGMLLSDREGVVLLAGPGVVGFFATNQSFDDELMSERRHRHIAMCMHDAVQCVIVRSSVSSGGFRDQGTAALSRDHHI